MNLIVILDTLKKEPAKKKSAFIPNIKKIYQIRKTVTLIKFWKNAFSIIDFT